MTVEQQYFLGMSEGLSLGMSGKTSQGSDGEIWNNTAVNLWLKRLFKLSGRSDWATLQGGSLRQ